MLTGQQHFYGGLTLHFMFTTESKKNTKSSLHEAKTIKVTIDRFMTEYSEYIFE